MGNIFVGGVSIDDTNKYAHLLKLQQSFINKSHVEPIKGLRYYMHMQNKCKPNYTEAMKFFFEKALYQSNDLIISIDIINNHIITGKTHIEIKIMENREQYVMLQGIRAVSGKAISLTCVDSTYSSELFSMGDKWYGHWYDGSLCGSIRLGKY
jgi:hypothetical protein